MKCRMIAIPSVGAAVPGITDAVFRLPAGLKSPRRGVVGPGAHVYPNDGQPGPAIGFLREALRWWDRWLGDVPNRVEREPGLIAWPAFGSGALTLLTNAASPWLPERRGRPHEPRAAFAATEAAPEPAHRELSEEIHARRSTRADGRAKLRVVSGVDSSGEISLIHHGGHRPPARARDGGALLDRCDAAVGPVANRPPPLATAGGLERAGREELPPLRRPRRLPAGGRAGGLGGPLLGERAGSSVGSPIEARLRAMRAGSPEDGDEPHTPLAGGTGERVHAEGARAELRPGAVSALRFLHAGPLGWGLLRCRHDAARRGARATP